MNKGIEMLLKYAQFEPIEVAPDVDKSKPYITHKGIIKMGKVKLPAYQMSDGTRVAPQETLNYFFL